MSPEILLWSRVLLGTHRDYSYLGKLIVETGSKIRKEKVHSQSSERGSLKPVSLIILV